MTALKRPGLPVHLDCKNPHRLRRIPPTTRVYLSRKKNKCHVVKSLAVDKESLSPQRRLADYRSILSVAKTKQTKKDVYCTVTHLLLPLLDFRLGRLALVELRLTRDGLFSS